MSPLIPISQVAILLGVSRSKVYQLCQSNDLPHIRIGSRLLFRQEDVEAWVNARVVGKQTTLSSEALPDKAPAALQLDRRGSA